jgi:hypothetical protein
MATNPLFNTALFNSALFGGPGQTAGLQPRQVGHGILYPALRKAGVTLGPGRTPSSAQFQDAIDELNRLTASLNCDRLFIYSLARAEYPLTVAQASYTIGLSPDPLEVIDFPAERPQLIDRANILQGGMSYPLALADADQWALIGQKSMPDSIPQILYNDRAYPVSTLYLWGQPIPGQTLELFTWTRVPEFQTVTDVVLLPPQYEDALVLNLAVRLAPHFQRVLDQNVREDARISLMRLESINAPQPIADLSGPLGCGCRYNVYTDQ